MLGLIGGSIIGPLSAFALKAELMTQAFRFTSSLAYAEKKQQNRSKKLKPIKKEDKVPEISKLEGDDKT